MALGLFHTDIYCRIKYPLECMFQDVDLGVVILNFDIFLVKATNGDTFLSGA